MTTASTSTPLSVQSGLSLVEILIALALSSLLISAAFSILADSSQSLNVQKGMNHINETSRFTLETVAREIRKAGYRDDVLINSSTVYPIDNDNQFDAGQSIRGTSRALTLRYQGSGNPADGRVLDCQGNPVSNTKIAVIRLRVVSGNLVCERLGNGWGTSQVLGAHVQGLLFEYGIDTNGDGEIDEYRAKAARGAIALSIKNTLVALDKAEFGTDGKTKTNLLQKSFSQLVSVRNNDS